MKLKFTRDYKYKLAEQVKYIAKDKPTAARRFKNDLLAKLNEVPAMPFKHRKSIFFERDEIRDFIFKGYVSVYKVNQEAKEIVVFGFVKYKEDPF